MKQHMLVLTVSALVFLNPVASAGALDQAIASAALGGYPLPAGWTVQFGSASGGMGECVHECMTIVIDPEVIDSVVPGLTGPASTLPGVLEQVLIHEIMHTGDGGGTGAGGNSACIEAPHQVVVAANNCLLATALALDGFSNANLCAFFKEVRDHYNGTAEDSKGAAAAWAAAGCAGTVPNMPACSACP